MTFQQEIALRTREHGQMDDLTERLAVIVAASGIQRGIANLAVIGSTAALAAIEFEPGLRRDLPEALDRLLPPSRNYHHEQTWHDGNGHSHLQSAWLGQSLTVPINAGAPVLGAWQQIVHLECDVRARERKIVVTVMGD